MKKFTFLFQTIVWAMVSCIIPVQAQSLNLKVVHADVIEFIGETTSNYVVQASSDLKSWEDLIVLPASASGTYQYTNFPTQEKLFYRTMAKAIPDVTFRLSPFSPMERMVRVSESSETPGVVLAVYDARSPVDANIAKLSLEVKPSGLNSLRSLFTRIYIEAGGVRYETDAISNGGTLDFSNLDIPLPAGVTVSFNLIGTVAPANSFGGTANTIVSMTTYGAFDGNANNPVVVGKNYHTLSVSGGHLTSNWVWFDTSVAGIKALSTRQKPVDNGAQPIWRYSLDFNFRVESGEQNIYIGKVISIGTEDTGVIHYSKTSGTFHSYTTLVSTGAVAGDTTTCFVIPAGTSREFTVTGIFEKSEDSDHYNRFGMTGIAYGFTQDEYLTRTVSFDGGPLWITF